MTITNSSLFLFVVVALIPYGGGTSVVGGVEPPRNNSYSVHFSNNFHFIFIFCLSSFSFSFLSFCWHVLCLEIHLLIVLYIHFLGCSKGVISVDMKHFDKVLRVDKESLIARVEAGISGRDLVEKLKYTSWRNCHWLYSILSESKELLFVDWIVCEGFMEWLWDTSHKVLNFQLWAVGSQRVLEVITPLLKPILMT